MDPWTVFRALSRRQLWFKSPTYRGSVYDNAKDISSEPLLANMGPYKDGLIVNEDTSIWEERQKDKRHFAYSTATAIKGLESLTRSVLRRVMQICIKS